MATAKHVQRSTLLQYLVGGFIFEIEPDYKPNAKIKSMKFHQQVIRQLD
jgi:hypothetical protein